ncbi:MAG: hypothetical protein M0Z31_02895 [Clostridia bacterium]|nr:hypothetical protein [Clostridia bacterium]
MKLTRLSLILTLSLALVMAISTAAFAAQAIDSGPVKGDGRSDYAATPKNTTTTYPGGIYLEYDANGVAKDIHSNYQRNTDACASCHATHTAVGASLLQWANVTDTCNACHDGTITTTYDVVYGDFANGTRTYGGLFGGTTEGPNSLSKHNVGEVNIAAAPGGNSAGKADGFGSEWGKSFECSSCHTPHGQGRNFRILHPDVNGLATINRVKGETLTSPDNLVFSSLKAPWLYGRPYNSSNFSDSTHTAVYVNGVKQLTGFSIDYKTGKVTFTSPPTGTVTAWYVPSFKVTGDVANKLTANEKVTYKEGFNEFCGACHTDYAALTRGDGKRLTGVYQEAYRHAFGFNYSSGPNKKGLVFSNNAAKSMTNEFTCMTCHVAHGADQTWWTDWKTKSGWEGIVSGENAGSSALKRLPNMATCESCHEKGKGDYTY